MTEDQVRDKAKEILGFEDTESAKSGVGQLTTFNKLGFKGINDKPDGWYLPNEESFPAIILEVKNDLTQFTSKQIDEILKNCRITHTKYKNVVGILYNGKDILVYKNLQIVEGETELNNKEYYLGLFEKDTIDKQKIYNLTKRINNSLHFKFGIKNLNHRMIFTACALVAKRYNAVLSKGMDYATFHTSIHSTLSKSLAEAKKQNQKLDLLLDVYSEIKMNITDNQEAIDDFIDSVTKISDNINSDFWQGEDVMAIFFNEFNRYKKKSETGQVFTPDHITSLMYRILGVNKDDVILDAACGSGAFLVKSMCNMIKEAGGNKTNKATKIKDKQLYGIEVDREIFALACANMLIHKDGKTNIENLDSTTPTAGAWIKSKPITKVLMNPPFEDKNKCLDIVKNVLNNVNKDVLCAFILPDNKLSKRNTKKAQNILKKHTLLKIIKLPEKTFSGLTSFTGTSIFIFKAGNKHPNNQPIFSCYIEDDGLIRIKNQGRQDVRNKWKDIENYWVDIIFKQTGDNTIQWININDGLHYKMPKKPFEVNEADFKRTILNNVLFKMKINEQDFKEYVIENTLFGNSIPIEIIELINKFKTNNKKILTDNWKEFKIGDLFEKIETKKLSYKVQTAEKEPIGNFTLPALTAGVNNQGLSCFVPKENATILKNVISVSANGENAGAMFFQEKEFTVLQDSYAIQLKNHSITRNEAFYLISVMWKAIAINHDWENKAGWNYIKDEIVKLPAKTYFDGNYEPDWNFMNTYIKNLPYYDCLEKEYECDFQNDVLNIAAETEQPYC